jgi:hypothetical protein
MRNEDAVRWFVALTVVASIAIVALFNDYRAEVWLPSLATNLATMAIGVYVINVLIAKLDADQRDVRRQRRARQRRLEAQLTGYIMTNIMMGCFESALKARKGGLNEWIKTMKDCHEFIEHGLRSIRYRMNLPDVWSLKARLHLSQLVLHLEDLLATKWDAPDADSRFASYMPHILGCVSDLATLTKNTPLEEQVRACEKHLGWPGASRGDLEAAIKRVKENLHKSAPQSS